MVKVRGFAAMVPLTKAHSSLISSKGKESKRIKAAISKRENASISNITDSAYSPGKMELPTRVNSRVDKLSVSAKRSGPMAKFISALSWTEKHTETAK
jgi:hypothetical protein